MMRAGYFNALFVFTLVFTFSACERLYSGNGGPTFTFTATLTDENQIALGIGSASFSATSIERVRLAGGTLVFSLDGPAPARILAGESLPAGSDFMTTEDSFGPAAMGRTQIGGEPVYIISWFPVAAIGDDDVLTAYTEEESITLFLLDFGDASPPRDAAATFQWSGFARAYLGAPLVGNEVVLEDGSGILVDDLTTDLDCFFCPQEGPSITSPALVGTKEGHHFSERLFASTGAGELNWSLGVTHSALGWLAIDPATGTLLGNPDIPGNYTVEVVVCDSCPDASGCPDLVEQCDSKTFTIRIKKARHALTVGWLLLGAICLAGLGRWVGRRSR